MIAVEVLLIGAAVPVVACCGYLALLALLSGQLPSPAPSTRRPRFDVIVPAHDEEAGIASTVASLLGLAYPRELFRVIVVADNCRDQTAARAAGAGARVLVREDAQQRGKGFALAFAFDQSLREGSCEAVVVVDADTVVSPNLLDAFAARLAKGAVAIQADYAVRNPEASWRTRLLHIALSAFHVLRSRARERLHLSAGLRGNGMCFAASLLREVPHRSVSLVEDVEYGLQLGEAGHRVHWAGEAKVRGEMVAGGAASRSQRERWERGRTLLRPRAARLLRHALRRRDGVLFDLAVDVLVPPLGTLALAAGGGLALSVVFLLAGGGGLPACLFAASCAALTLYLLRGWMLSGTGARGLFDLALAPVYLFWKVSLKLRGGGPDSRWIRTAREADAAPRGRD